MAKKISYLLSDRTYIRLGYVMTFGKFPSLDNPTTYTEKIQRFKLHQTAKIYSDLSDKYAVRKYVQEKIGNDILIPLYRYGENPEEIPFDTLPDSFVVKCNHGSKYNIFVENKKDIDKVAIKHQLYTWLKKDFWRIGRELQYKGICKKIVIEKRLTDKETFVPLDYKFYCFQGIPIFIMINSDRFGEHKVNIVDINRNEQAFGCNYQKTKNPIPKPVHFESMCTYASTLSYGFPFMRVDFYHVNDKVYFGEITLTPDAGYGTFFPNHNEIDKMLGDLIVLPENIY